MRLQALALAIALLLMFVPIAFWWIPSTQPIRKTRGLTTINWKEWASRALKVFGWFILMILAFFLAHIAFFAIPKLMFSAGC
jgi:hypothetical protein